MTTVAAIARDGLVHMACDAMANVYERPITGGVQKMAHLAIAGGGHVLMGWSGDGAYSPLIRRALHLHDAPDPADPQAGQDFADAVAIAVTELARDHGVTENGRSSGTVLLGWYGRLWTLAHAVAVYHADGVAAIGSGEGPAMGAMDALLGNGIDARVAVQSATRIAIVRDRYSGGPITYLALTADESLPSPGGTP